MVGIRWCVLGTARLQVIADQLYLTLLTPSPPPPHAQGLHLLLIPRPLSPSCLSLRTRSHRGVSENFLWYKLLALICIITPSSVFPFGMSFRTFTQHFFAKNVPFLCRTIIFEKPFFRFLLLHLSINEIMPITYFEGIKRPCNPSGTQSLTFMRERGDGRMIGNKGLQLSLPDHSVSTFKICIC